MRLKVGDDFLDGDSVIAQTFAVNEIGNIESRQGGFSNNFTLPLTSKNQNILGIPGNINSSSRNPYSKVESTLYDRGTPVAFGSLKFQTVDRKELKCTFFSDNSEWFAAIKDKKLSDLDLSEWDHTWDASNIDDSSLTTPNTDGYIYPLIDYGEFGAEATQTAGITQLYPAMFVHTLVSRILFEAGWKLEGDLKDHALYKKMILPFASEKLTYSSATIDDNTATTNKLAPEVLSGCPCYMDWSGVGVTHVPAADFVTPGVYNVNFQLVVTNYENTTVSLYLTGVLVDSGWQTITANGTYNYNSAGHTVAFGDYFEVRLNNSPGTTTTIGVASFFTYTLTDEIIEDSTIEMNRAVPNIKQSDLIRYVFFTFGVISQANVFSKTVDANFFRTIKNNLLNALDWSNKIDQGQTQEIDYTKLLNKYKSISIFKYKEDSNDNELGAYEIEAARSFGEGQFDLANDHISGIATIYTSPFSAMINIVSFVNEFYVPQIRWLTSAGVKDVTPVPKVGLIETELSVSLLSGGQSSSFSYGGNATGTMPFCWFVKTDYTTETDLFLDTLAYDQVAFPNASGTPMIERFLEDYESILNTPKMLKASILLNEVDISELDFTIPIYLNAYKAYFYISKIKNFQGRHRVTECELVKIDA